MSDTTKLYQSLDVGVDGSKIRVLDLLPGFWYSGLRTEMRVVSLASKPYYEALSYPCGSSSEGRTLIANSGCHLPIYNNLYRALCRLRYRFNRRTLWVDAACINQADDVEKGHQVANMASIYRNAISVNIWLGESGFVFPVDLRMLFQPWMLIPSHEVMFMFIPRDMWRVFRNHPLAMERAIAKTTPRWQDRAWTVQEFIVANQLRFYYGGRTAEHDMDSLRYIREQAWDDLPNLKSFIDHLGMVLTHLKGHHDNSPKLGYKRSDEETLGLIDCVQSLAASQARDPRDKVYSIRGIINERERSLLRPDYTLTTALAFGTATHASMIARNDTEILRLITLANRRTDGLRSWIADFMDVERMVADVNLANIHLFKIPVLRLEDHHPNWDVTFDSSKEALTIPGYPCDKVVDTLPFEPHTCTLDFSGGDAPLPPETLRQITKFVRRAAEAARRALRGDDLGPSGIHLLHERAAQDPQVWGRASTLVQMNIIPTSRQQDIAFHRNWHRSFRQILSDALVLWSLILPGGRMFTKDCPYSPAPQQRWDAETFGTYAMNAAGEYCLFLTSAGLLGLAPSPLEAGDTLVLVRSLSPFLVLHQRLGGTYEFRGLAFVHEFMDCCPWEIVGRTDADLERFVVQ